MLGVHVEAGPSTQEIIATLERCKGWSRDDRKRLAVAFKGRDISGCYTINGFAQALQGRKGRKQFKEAILSQTRVINFVQKDTGEMFPKWEFDVEDTLAEIIIKLMFPTVVSPAKKNVVKEDSPRPRKKARKDAAAEATAEATYAMREGFGTCLKEIKYLSERVEVVEKKSESVNGTNAGRKSLAEDKGPDVPAAVPAAANLQKKDARYLEKRDASLALCRAKSDRTRKLAASQQSPYTANSTARVIISNRKLYPGYNPFAPIDKKKLKELADWLKTCPHYRTALDKKPRKSRTWWYQILRTSLEWLEDCVIVYHMDAWINVLRKRYDANPQHFRSERMCFLDHLFAQQWRFNFKDFKDSEPDQNVNFADTHWIAMWISIPKRHIVVFDIICSSISPEELDVFSKKDFAKANGKRMRDKMAVDIFQELPDAHEFENKDVDDNLDAYDGLNTGRLN
ncbi:BnaC08g47030D [Brassica napus]|uniref:BnaC08g47030D protein n=1 Tax=Brassica napus TaxID=3708 RepID=A0A078I1M9_BRANA|nr:BnaC08g47030D [Brassica napus]